jgi:hypothetical protein
MHGSVEPSGDAWRRAVLQRSEKERSVVAF